MTLPDSEAPARASQSLVSEVFQRLHADIVACRLPPGTKLHLHGLSASYDVSFSVVREALSRLTSLGLVTTEPQRGFRVAPASVQNLLDLTKTRIWIEALALRMSIAHGDRAWEAKVIAADHLLGREQPRRKPDGSVDEQWRREHEQYHDALVSGFSLENLMIYRQNLFALSDRYRRLGTMVAPSRDVTAEHDAITEAVLARDRERAVALMRDHLLHTTELVLGGAPGFQGNTAETMRQLRQDIATGLAEGAATFDGSSAKRAALKIAGRRASRGSAK